PAVAEMRPLHTHPGGSVFLHDERYLRDLGGLELRQDEILVRLDTTGAPVDTTSLPNQQYRRPGLQVRTATRSIGTLVPFTPERGWSVTASGEIVAMMGDRYAVDVYRADGSVLRITRAVEAIPVSADERAAEQERITASFRRFVSNWSWDGPAIPNTKPPLSWLHTGRDGTIWVRIAQPGIVISVEERTPNARTFVREPLVFDVFESDGRFLGQVHAPEALQLIPFPVLQGDQVWAVVQDGGGVNYVARFRVVPEG
ncbi:MAG: hypothetical protein LC667_10555, partial [Thioalkalivibrio sp.]|nr:hypothetical protein [Thioalkalivibrio sp.]